LRLSDQLSAGRGLQGQRMELVSHAPLQGLVDHLVLLNAGLALEGAGDDIGRVVVAVTAFASGMASLMSASISVGFMGIAVRSVLAFQPRPRLG
jgi:hypothetical protein